jgi:hypothetical protein
MENFMSDNPAKREAIEQRAYELYLARGCEPGMELDDWLAAEQEVGLKAQEPQPQASEVAEVAKRHAPKRIKSAIPASLPVA